jgi:hypothetical protein
VTLSNPSAAAVTVGYNTTDGTATDGNDYTGTTGSLTFAPGVTTQVVTVNIKNDGIYEGSETFNVNLSTPTNATIADGVGIGTIKDDGSGLGGSDDDRPRGYIDSPTVVEGGNLDFNVVMSNISTTPTIVTLAPASGTATRPIHHCKSHSMAALPGPGTASFRRAYQFTARSDRQ